MKKATVMLSDFDINTFMLTLMAVAQAFTAFWVYMNGKRSKLNAENIEKIEKATNSMKDALVKTTGEAEKAKGILEGRQENIDKVLQLAVTQQQPATTTENVTITAETATVVAAEVKK